MKLTQTLAQYVRKRLPVGFGFALLVFRFNEPGRCDYASNADRESMVKALREAADKLENGQEREWPK